MPQFLAQPTDALLRQNYALAQQALGGLPCLVLLHLGAQHSGFALGTGPQAQSVHGFALGLERLAAAHFKTTPPTALAMENAITVVEDVVMPLRAAMPQQAQLASCDAALHEIARLSGLTPAAGTPLVLSLEALERTFNRLSNVVEGRPAAHEGLPQSNAFAAALLVLREFMHHLQFTSIALVQGPAPCA